MKKIVGNI